MIFKASSCVAALCLLLPACSDDSKPTTDGSGKDHSVVDGGPGVPDGHGPLWPCEEVGKACNAHDPCAIDPVCGADKLCKPTSLQSCDDQLPCTQDTCKGMGLCDNVPNVDTCALPVKVGGSDGGAGTTELRCFKKGDLHPEDPCQMCDPEVDARKWSPANGGACDDGDDCTKDDYCQLGTCKGVSYLSQCADELGCTDDKCDGKGGCLGNTLKSDYCLINNVCYKDQGTHPDGTCFICDVKTSQSAWTAVTDTCLINSKCYTKGATITGGCAECDPTVSTTQWTVKGSYCLIVETCKNPGNKDLTGCNECDPTKNKYDWSTLASTCFINGKCYSTGDKNTAATCAECDPTVSSTSWTVKGTGCYIAQKCYTTGQANTGACATCDPTKSKYAWTPSASKCLISDKCYSDGDKHSSTCLQCTSTVSPTQWSAVGTTKVAFTDFETGAATGWTIVNADSDVGWVVSTKRPAGGSYSLYYGDPATGTFDSGLDNSGTATMPAVTLAAGKKAGLTFMLYMDTETGDYYDTLKVYVGSTVVWEKDVTATVTMLSWIPITINLTTYAGQTVNIKFEFDTVDSISNDTEGVYIDDIAVYNDC